MARFRVKAYRQCHPDHTDFSATIRASERYAFRFNPEGEFGVLYVALAPETARGELERQAQRLGIPVARLAPRLMLHIRVSLTRVLDLTDAATRRSHGLTLKNLSSDDYTPCQAVAREARQSGYEAILYPSATGAGKNLAIFYDGIDSSSSVQIVGHEILPLAD